MATKPDARDRLERDLVQGTLHLLILAHLARGPLHGYALIKAMEETTGPGYWKEGTIYPLLARMDKEGLLKSTWSTGDGPPRKTYTLTRQGTRLLAHGRTAWTDLRDAMDTLL